MHVVSVKMGRDYWERHPDTENALRAWFRYVEHSDWKRFADVRVSFPSADQVGKFTLFNIGGNKCRLIAAIHYNRDKVFVRAVLTHEDYDAGAWKRG